jgi:diacylglycerol kinase (ATP)
MQSLIIANPVSGAQAAPQVAERVRQLLRAAGREAELVLTTAKGDAFRWARQAAEQGTGQVVVCGGDGTLQEAATALAGSGAALGIIPRGRCNDFAHALGLHRSDSPERLAEIILQGRTRAIDLGAVGDRRFLTVATLGFDSEASRFVETRKLWVRGTPAYLYAVVRVLMNFQFPLVRLRGDFGQFEGRILLAATGNSPSYGGAMRITPGARLDDGLFHITVVEAVPALTVLSMLPRVMKGTHLTHPKVRTLVSRSVEIETPGGPAWICADGESLVQTPCRFEVCPQVLRVIVP